MTVALLLTVVVLPAAPAAASTTHTVTFSYTGAPQTWVVPLDVTEVSIEAWGAQGGSQSAGGTGGLGAYAKRTVTVVPGEVLSIRVGGEGSQGLGSTGGAGGFNGGGRGGNGLNTIVPATGGGGASDVRRGGDGLDRRVIVAAGGGGCSAKDDGTGGTAFRAAGVAGSLGAGGAGGDQARRPGGGGGGGYYGGGGGQAADFGGGGGFGGGAGGAATGADGAGNGDAGGKGGTQTAGGLGGNDAVYHDGGGGGGSSYAPGGQTTAGVRSGNGLVTITYESTATEPNVAPEAPEILYPTAGAMFEPGQRQDFTLKTTDANGDSYTGHIRFKDFNGDYVPNKVVDTHLAPSGVASSGTLGTDGLDAGTYTMQATATDIHGATSATTEQQVGVAAPGGPPCTAAGTLVDGWFGDRYLQVSTATVGDVGYVCLRTAQAGEEVAGKFGGWLRAEANGGVSGGGPTVGTTAACDPADAGLAPFPLLDQTVGPPGPGQVSVWGGLIDSGTSVTACLRLSVGSSTLLDHAVTITAPDGVQLSDLNFIPEASWATPMEVAPPAGLPSSECYEAPGRQRYINATVDGQHVWLYSQSADDTTRLCARIHGASDRGVVVRQQSGSTGEAVTWQVGLPVDHPDSPCAAGVQWYSADAPYHARLRTSAPEADPLGVCLSAGLTGPTLAAWLAVDRSPGTPVTSHEVDS